jgi:predicted ATP-grasp superfamily ATP-dependent carboligase
MITEHLLIFGASTRAAAFSAMRAGWRPWCVDLFADRDLQLACGVRRLQGKYPQALLEAMKAAPPAAWMYTGGLENWPELIEQMAGQRPLLGTGAEGLRRSRDPFFVHHLFTTAGLPVPAVRRDLHDVSVPERWLRKPLRGAGGVGIQVCHSSMQGRGGPRHYFQELIAGMPTAALYLANEQQCTLLGLTQQLVGVAWLHAGPFHYCGSIGPLHMSASLLSAVEHLGRVLITACNLNGVFGVDGILHDGAFWPVEINPRYTASVEVLEHAGAAPVLGPSPRRHPLPPPVSTCVGKAILFALRDLRFPAEGPWLSALSSAPTLELLSFADVPSPGELIAAGRPVLSFFTRGESPVACEEQLRQIAAGLDQRLFGA